MSAPFDSPPATRETSLRFWNVLAAFALLLLAGWTLAADGLHRGHFLLQSSLSSLFLGLWVSVWTLAAVAFAGFPKRFVIAAAVLVTLRLSFAWPLLRWVDLRIASLVLDTLLVILALAYALVAIASASLRTRPWFRWQHSVAMGLFVLVLSTLSLPVGVLGLASVIETSSRGYVRLTPRGLELAERVFEKDGRRVHLVGMAHIAESDFYVTLNQRLADPSEGRRIVLLEGVSDRDGILPRSFASGDTYRALAERLGLAEQTLGFAVSSGAKGPRGGEPVDWEELGVVFRHADIDVSEMAPEHREGLVGILESMEGMGLADFFKMPEGLTSEAVEDLIVEGLVKHRNGKLMEVFAEEEASYEEIYIPWGAAHMPDLERRLVALGYLRTGETRRLGIDFLKRFRP